MARFRGTLKGSRGEGARQGDKKSGLKATIEGWDCGVEVIAWVDSLGNDCFTIYETSGSDNNNGPDKLIAIIRR